MALPENKNTRICKKVSNGIHAHITQSEVISEKSQQAMDAVLQAAASQFFEQDKKEGRCESHECLVDSNSTSLEIQTYQSLYGASNRP